jgi:tRNA (guanine-N7-)-methyltransferase
MMDLRTAPLFGKMGENNKRKVYHMRLRNIPGADEIVENSAFCIQNPAEHKGHWQEFLGNKHPIHIEIGMGKGRFLMELAALHPDISYIGIERYTSVLLRAVQKMEESPLPNVHFLCIDAATLPDIFAEDEVDRIYLNFSDPWPKDRHAKRRLTSREFLARYDQFLAADGRIEFKTDNQDLFTFSLEEIEASPRWKLDASTRDLHHDAMMNEGNVMTEYEEKFSAKGNPICKLVTSRS